MQTIHDLPVFQRSYDLYKEVYLVVKQFPKGDRYALGESCKVSAIELINAIIEAASVKNELKIIPLDRAISCAERLKVFIRLGQDTGCIKEARYISLQTYLQEIGHMLGGWRRSV